MAKQIRVPEPEPIKGDPDFAGVARERLQGPADYDESAGNEVREERGERAPEDVASEPQER